MLSETKIPEYTLDDFLDISDNEKLLIHKRRFYDEALEAAATGLSRARIIGLFREDYLRNRRGDPQAALTQWVRDFAQLAAGEVDRALAKADEALGNPRRLEADPITEGELLAARDSPTVLVAGLLVADVRVLAGAGGTGKSTLALFEAAAIAGGAESLWGRRILQHGPTVYLTAEDSREIVVARLRHLIVANGWGDRQDAILSNLHIVDVSGSRFRLVDVSRDSIAVSSDVDDLLGPLRRIGPKLIVLDPISSLGAAEHRPNDSAQALVEAARILRNEIGCCVTLVSHTGKVVAREGMSDQYAARGGSALPDGCRMVGVLSPVTAGEWTRTTGTDLAAGEDGLRLALPKMTHAQRLQDVFIRRSGFRFEAVESVGIAASSIESQDDQLLELLRADVGAGRFPTRNSIDGRVPRLSRPALKQAVDRLLRQGMIVERPVPPNGRRGGARNYLHPAVCSVGLQDSLRVEQCCEANAAAPPSPALCSAAEQMRGKGKPTDQRKGAEI